MDIYLWLQDTVILSNCGGVTVFINFKHGALRLSTHLDIYCTLFTPVNLPY